MPEFADNKKMPTPLKKCRHFLLKLFDGILLYRTKRNFIYCAIQQFSFFAF